MLRAFASVVQNHPNAKLLFVGPDESGSEIENVLKTNPQLSDNVINVGKVENHELYLAISDVLCLPSYREGFGSIVIDAAAMGVPAIGSNIPGLVDSIEDGKTGILFPAGDVGALAGIMMDFLENPGKYKNMRLSAKARVDALFTADLLYESLKSLYLELANGQRGVKVEKHG